MAGQSLTLVVLAAGLGSRYGGLKQLDPMGPNGEPLLDYAVFDALRAGFSRIVFVIREELAEAFERTIGVRYRHCIPVEYAFQSLTDIPARFSVPEGRVRPWGTLHAVLAARKLIDGPFATINADDFYGLDTYLALARFLGDGQGGEGERMCLVGYPLRATLSGSGVVNRGVCREQDGWLAGVAEHRSIALEDDGACYGLSPAGERVRVDLDCCVSMNCWGFRPSALEKMADFFGDFLVSCGDPLASECYIPSFVDALIASGQGGCRILGTSAAWFGVTYPDDKPDCVARIRRLIEAGVYPECLWGKSNSYA